jgi:hypothetical protein
MSEGFQSQEGKQQLRSQGKEGKPSKTKGWVRTETAKAEAQWTTGHAFQGE